MVLLMGNMIKKTEMGYHQMNLALKEHVEKKINLRNNWRFIPLLAGATSNHELIKLYTDEKTTASYTFNMLCALFACTVR